MTLSQDSIRVMLPGGLWWEGGCQREALLRRLTGDEEAFLVETGDALLPIHRVTALLFRCLVQLGAIAPVTLETIRSLTVGDREALLLQLRRLTFGNRIQCVLDCPNPNCGEKLDLELEVANLLARSYSHFQPQYDTTFSTNRTSYTVKFRLPTGADQEAAAQLAAQDSDGSANLILRRCIERIIPSDGHGKALKKWPVGLARKLSAVMSELDPQAEIVLNLNCTVCHCSFSVLFDTATYFFQEIRQQARDLYHEIHLLAFHYHWPEKDILAMTAARRRRYLDFLVEGMG